MGKKRLQDRRGVVATRCGSGVPKTMENRNFYQKWNSVPRVLSGKVG